MKLYKTKRNVNLAVAAIIAVAFATTVVLADPVTKPLCAGQHINAGTVTVSNVGNNLTVTYDTSGGDWALVETHLAVGDSLDDIPQNKNGNPIPGHFPDSNDHDPPEQIVTYTIDISGLGSPLYIAAHAAVQKTIVLEEAPYAAISVVDVNQGLRKDGTPVRWQRSDPNQGLEFETGQTEFNFFSLGFDGWIIVEFGCPIRNGDGNDLKIIEDTWGSYPLETADVYASQDGVTWTYLGEADNTTRDVIGIHSISEFDLGALTGINYIKIEDTTDPAVHNSAADGYDLNAVLALQDCIETEEETAWGDGCEGTSFPGRNWATYFTYVVR